MLSACATTRGSLPAVEIRTVEVVKEVQRPCPVAIPERPAPLVRPLPEDSTQLSALLGLKLAEYAGPGGFADRVLAALVLCTKEASDVR